MNLDFKEVDSIPKNARIQNLIRLGIAKFIDIEIKKDFNSSSDTFGVIQVISNDITKDIS